MVLIAFLLVIVAAGGARAETRSVWDSVPETVAAPSDTLRFADVLVRVKQSGPALRALAQRATAARATVAQSGAWPNPFLLAEAENVDGSYSGVERAEFSLWLLQEFELGGKRARRVDQATATAGASLQANATESFAVYLLAQARYADAVHADEALRLARETESVVVELARSADDRVRAGATLTADASLAAAELARTRFAIRSAESEKARARVALSSLWGEQTGFDEPLARRMAGEHVALPADSASAWARSNPMLEEIRLAGHARRADAALERSLRVPNLAVGVGARRIEADDATTLLFSAGLPLPLWDRRASAIDAAEASARAADLEIERVHSEATMALGAHLRERALLQARMQESETNLVPSVTAALANMRVAYGIGRVSYSDLLDIQRALVSLHTDINDTRRAIVEETVAIERLAGRTIEELMSHE